MLYNSFVFIFLFLPCILVAYYGVAACFPARMANLTLVAGSLVFYGYWEWRNVFLIIASLGVNYGISILLLRHRRKWLLITGISLNLLCLGYYKYAGFFLANLDALLPGALPVLRLALPLGISFFTFQQIAFLVDTYQGKAVEADFSRYCLFVTFFPQLIAGPIVHHTEMMPQFKRPGAKRFNAENFSAGLLMFTIGLAKKVMVADNLAPIADLVFNDPAQAGTLDAWAGSLAYMLQLYFDFSGYSDMAIGLGKFFNIDIPQNFNSPYKAASVADFWRRWHITLSRFLREYLYIPLGGNRRGPDRTRFNLFVTMLLGGLWHGANWTFVFWGGYHGALLLLHRWWRRSGFQMPAAVARTSTFFAVLVGWVFFRAASVSDAFKVLGAMSRLDRLVTGQSVQFSFGIEMVVGILCAVLMVLFAPNSNSITTRHRFQIRYAVACGVLFFLCLLAMNEAVITNEPTKFLYFDF